MKLVHRWFQVVVGCGALGVVSIGDVSPSRADSCSSQATCERYAACPAGWTNKKVGTSHVCTLASGASSVKPTCGPLNAMDDWKWDEGDKICYRTRENGQRVNAQGANGGVNRECQSGYDYKPAGMCEKPAGTNYLRAHFSTSTTAPMTLPICSTESACKKTVDCPDGYSLYTVGAEYSCKKVVPNSTHTPTCGPLNLMDDWKWDEDDKVCYRKKENGQRVTAQGANGGVNRECQSGYGYVGSSGKCEKAGGTYWSTPTWQ